MNEKFFKRVFPMSQLNPFTSSQLNLFTSQKDIFAYTINLPLKKFNLLKRYKIAL